MSCYCSGACRQIGYCPNRGSSLVYYMQSLQLQQQAIVQQAQANNWPPQQTPPLPHLWSRKPMTASDLGIVDRLLDDKVGMEP